MRADFTKLAWAAHGAAGTRRSTSPVRHATVSLPRSFQDGGAELGGEPSADARQFFELWTHRGMGAAGLRDEQTRGDAHLAYDAWCH